MNPILLSVAGNPENQDRGRIIYDGPKTILCVADGAGGLSGGREAAIMATEWLRCHGSHATNAESCGEALRTLDTAIFADALAGETTCVLVVVSAYEIFGASVGDSGAWFVPTSGSLINLTQFQKRKPFLGSGSAQPIPFRHSVVPGNLLLATDGLLKYTSAEKITAVCRDNPFDLAPHGLLELVRFPSGAFPDDVTVILYKVE